MSIHPLKAYEKKNARSRESGIQAGWPSSFIPGRRVPRSILVDFTRSFALMIKARLSLLEALDTSTKQCKNELFKSVLLDVRKQVESGTSLAESFGKYNQVFDPLYLCLVRVGEIAGVLPEVLLRIATYQEKSEALRRKIRQALTYPAFVLLVAIGATAFLLTSIVPTFAEMFADFEAELPAPTRLILSVSEFLTRHVGLLLGLSILILASLFWLKNNSRFLFILDRKKLNLPLFGTLFRQSLIARFCRTLGTLMKSGITLVDGLKILNGTTGNRYLDARLVEATRSVSRGKALHATLKNTDLFPALVIHMIKVGEQTGDLDKMLIEAARHFEAELDAVVESMGAILEPLLIVLVGVIMGGILIAMYLPMFDLVNIVG